MRYKFAVLRHVLFLIIVPLLLIGGDPQGCEDLFPDPPGTEITPDTHPRWDSDGDGISTEVEMNDANSYLPLDTNVANTNPTIAHGVPCNGWIEKALNLVNENTGYYHYNPE